MMFPFPIQLIIPIEHYSPHALAKPYANSATPGFVCVDGVGYWVLMLRRYKLLRTDAVMQ
ncbi:hypothetical protein QUA04_28300 [Microcoleus sp. S13_C5]